MKITCQLLLEIYFKIKFSLHLWILQPVMNQIFSGGWKHWSQTDSNEIMSEKPKRLLSTTFFSFENLHLGVLVYGPPYLYPPTF